MARMLHGDADEARAMVERLSLISGRGVPRAECSSPAVCGSPGQASPPAQPPAARLWQSPTLRQSLP
eukprot:82428-Chlamydomonas_euryale.AAC.1